ncbi:MAG: aminoacyl-tRNA hydrolase [Actinobacteria bacterium]|nr:aminoacyl-tRNA hydrolase [Actinomycetota bacterium]
MTDDELFVSAQLRIPRAEITERFDTSGGPGGQHANKTATRVEVSFDVDTSPSLTDEQRDLIIGRLGPTIRVSVDVTRSQARNRDLAAQRLAERLASALVVAAPRRATRPSRAAERRRLDAKRRRADIKSSRRRPRFED